MDAETIAKYLAVLKEVLQLVLHRRTEFSKNDSYLHGPRPGYEEAWREVDNAVDTLREMIHKLEMMEVKQGG